MYMPLVLYNRLIRRTQLNQTDVSLTWVIASIYNKSKANWGHVMTFIWVNSGSGNGLLPDGTKPLPEPMLTYHQWDSVALK